MLGRRSFLKTATTGLVALGLGAKEVVAQLIGSKYKFVMDSGPAPETAINGKRYLYFGGTGYFAFQTHPEVIKAAQKALADFGTCSATSRNVFGTFPIYLEVEKKAGEFFTPSSVVRTIVEVLQPFNGRVYDPCCGSGGMFVQSKKFVENHSGNINKLSIYGQDSNPTTWKMCMMNLAIRGIDANLGQFNADTFYNDCHPTLKADFIMANPPFNLSDWGADKLADDKRWKYGVPPAGNANFAWMQHMIFHLAPNGKLGLVLANGSLSSQSGGEGEIRKKIVEADLVEGIIAMPSQLFFTTQIPVSLWFLSKSKAQKGKTLFIDARNMGTMVSRRLREMTDADIAVFGSLENIEAEFALARADGEIASNEPVRPVGRSA